MSPTPTPTRTAIVTGASRGLGLALTSALSRDGWRVVATARTADDLVAATAGLPGVTAVAGDVADADHRHRLVATAGPRLDLLVNGASLLGPSPLPRLADVALSALREVLEVNVVAPLGLVQTALPALRAAGGIVIDVTSDAAEGDWEGWGTYGASKAALDRVSAVLGTEEPQLAVYALDPGDMRTRMHADACPGEDISDRPLPEAVVGPILDLVARRPSSGRYRVADLAVADLAVAARPEEVRA